MWCSEHTAYTRAHERTHSTDIRTSGAVPMLGEQTFQPFSGVGRIELIYLLRPGLFCRTASVTARPQTADRAPSPLSPPSPPPPSNPLKAGGGRLPPTNLGTGTWRVLRGRDTTKEGDKQKQSSSNLNFNSPVSQHARTRVGNFGPSASHHNDVEYVWHFRASALH